MAGTVGGALFQCTWPGPRLIGSRKVRGADKLKSVVKTEREKDGVSVRDRERGGEERKRETDRNKERGMEREEGESERERK